MDAITTTSRGDGIRILTLGREPVNALDRDTVLELQQRVLEVEAEPGAQTIIITSSLHHFSAGADLKMAQTFDPAMMGQWTYLIQRVFDTIERVGLPTIAAIRGAAMGGGLELALACDFRIATPDARLALPEARKGILPGGGGTQRLKRSVGYSKAAEILIFGRDLSGTEALHLGLVNRIAADPLEAAVEMAHELHGVSRPSIAAIKRCLQSGEFYGYGFGTLAESVAAGDLAHSDEYRAGVGQFGRP